MLCIVFTCLHTLLLTKIHRVQNTSNHPMRGYYSGDWRPNTGFRSQRWSEACKGHDVLLMGKNIKEEKKHGLGVRG